MRFGDQVVVRTDGDEVVGVFHAGAEEHVVDDQHVVAAVAFPLIVEEERTTELEAVVVGVGTSIGRCRDAIERGAEGPAVGLVGTIDGVRHGVATSPSGVGVTEGGVDQAGTDAPAGGRAAPRGLIGKAGLVRVRENVEASVETEVSFGGAVERGVPGTRAIVEADRTRPGVAAEVGFDALGPRGGTNGLVGDRTIAVGHVEARGRSLGRELGHELTDAEGELIVHGPVCVRILQVDRVRAAATTNDTAVVLTEVEADGRTDVVGHIAREADLDVIEAEADGGVVIGIDCGGASGGDDVTAVVGVVEAEADVDLHTGTGVGEQRTAAGVRAEVGRVRAVELQGTGGRETGGRSDQRDLSKLVHLNLRMTLGLRTIRKPIT